MKKYILSVICCCLMLCVLAACSTQSNNSTPNSSTVTPFISTTSDVTPPEGDNSSVPDTTASVPSTEESSTGTSTPETTESSIPETSKQPTTDAPVDTTAPPTPEAPTTKPSETIPPVTEPSETTPPITKPPVTEEPIVTPSDVAAQKITATLSAYTSVNESSPYLKGKAIYQVLYGGERTQIGDTLTFNLSVEPANHTDTISVTVTDNISYSLVGTTLTVNVNSFGDIGSGRITVYVCDPKSGAIHTSTKISFAIDSAGNPYDDPSGIFSSYIRTLGMSYTTVSEGYTTADPSLSFTQFAGAPAWDDQILKSENDWLSRCFWLLEQYADEGFKKVNFIETATSFGFSASK